MKVFKKVLKNKLFYLFIVLGVFVIPIFKFNLNAQEDDYVEVDSTLEFNVIDFTTNEVDVDPATVYNFFRNGFMFNDDVTFLLNDVEYKVTSYIIDNLRRYTIEIDVDGESYKITSSPTTLDIYSYTPFDDDDVDNLENMRFIWSDDSSALPRQIDFTFDDIIFISNNTIYNKIYFYTIGNNYQAEFRYYKEYDDYDDAYYNPWGVLPEYRIIDFISGNLDNIELINTFKGGGIFYDMDKGFNNDDNIKITLRSLIPTSYFEFIDEAQYEAKYNDGYNQAREDYGYYDEEADKWLKVDERTQQIYDEGYQDGEDDTRNYYDDNGLFIPRLTPKGHLVVENDSRYGEPYFYLQDFHNEDDEYFQYQNNRWLEKAFDWAYNNETDFLAINDLYTIKYDNDDVIYKYFFYKYETDSVYFYNDNGTLFKIVDRVDFDYYIYEAPELSQEEQTRIDRAYNKGKSDYGYYDSQLEEYLTATEYGEIQYNLGVISIRDTAYLNGFHTGMLDSHKYGFDWMLGTYWELIEQRPILQNLRDNTSFTYQLAHTKGFNEAREEYGYWDGRVWVSAQSIAESSYTGAYDDGFRDAINERYDDIYDEIYDKGYNDGQKVGMNDKFYTGLEKWLVPAIIVVLFFGLLMLFPKNKED